MYTCRAYVYLEGLCIPVGFMYTCRVYVYLSHDTLPVSCYPQSLMLLSKSHATLKVPCYYEQILILNWTGDIPKLSQGHPRSSQSCTWVLAWARPGWGMAWDGKVSFRVHKTIGWRTLPELAELDYLSPGPWLGAYLLHVRPDSG